MLRSTLLVLAFIVSINICGSAPPNKSTTAAEPTKKLSEAEHHFQVFKQKFNKKYSSTKEEQDRLKLFEQNLKTIEILKGQEKGTAVYGITEMADWSREEFLAQRASLKSADIAGLSKFIKKVNISQEDIPKAFDWRTLLFVSSVKDQKTCGSSWAFAPVSHIENIHAKKTGFLEDFSVQQLIDCSKTASGCNGGNFTSAFQTTLNFGGLVPENKYPYIGRQNATAECKFSPKDIAVKLKEFAVLETSELMMPGFIATEGSTVNAINADRLQFYVSGVISTPKEACNPTNTAMNHMVLVVGYGKDSASGLNYWTVKNSWGKNWGESGYFRVSRGNNTCGIANYFATAILQG